MNDVRIYDKNMKLKTTIPAEDLNKRYWVAIGASQPATSLTPSSLS